MKFIIKLTLIVFLLLFSRTLFSFEVKFTGLNKLSLSDINVIVSENIFESLNVDQLNTIIQELYRSDLVYDIQTSYDKDNYYINIDEAKIIENIFFNGNTFVDNDDIKLMIKSRIDRLINKNSIGNDIKTILSYYNSIGFNNANITSQLESFSDDRVNLIFNINEGNKSKLVSVDFIGNKFFSDSYLRDIIKSEDIGFFDLFDKGSNLSPDLFLFDLNLIKDVYSSKGFFDAIINYELSAVSKDTYELNFYIIEGVRQKITQINYEFISNNVSKKLTKIKNTFQKKLSKKNNFYDKKFIDKHIQDLNNFLTLNNLENNFFTYNFNHDSKNNDLFFFEMKSDPITINKITIQGNTITKDKTIRSKLLFESGDLLNTKRLKETNDNLNRLKYVNQSNISYTLQNEKADILINLKENNKTGNFLIAGSFSGDTGAGFAFGLNDGNIFGSGNELNSSFNINAEKTTFNIKYVDYPTKYNYLKNTYSFFNEDKDFTDSYGFKTKNYGFAYTIGLKIDENSNFSSGVSYENVESYDAKKNITSINDNIGNFDNFNFSINYNFNTTNDIFYPTNGIYQSINLKISPDGISDDNYYKFNLESDFYKSFESGNFIFALNNLGYADSYDNNLKTINSFGLGGLNFKGFDFRGIGPYSDNIYLGGNKYFTSSLGYGSNFLFDKKDNVNIKFFYTAGSIWDSDYATKNNFKLRSSLGVSLDFLTPVGPLAIFYAIPIVKSTEDKIRNFNFALGTSF